VATEIEFTPGVDCDVLRRSVILAQAQVDAVVQGIADLNGDPVLPAVVLLWQWQRKG
jgi:hypothetical protein